MYELPKCIPWMQCKSIWKKVSTNCVNEKNKVIVELHLWYSNLSKSKKTNGFQWLITFCCLPNRPSLSSAHKARWTEPTADVSSHFLARTLFCHLVRGTQSLPYTESTFCWSQRCHPVSEKHTINFDWSIKLYAFVTGPTTLSGIWVIIIKKGC